MTTTYTETIESNLRKKINTLPYEEAIERLASGFSWAVVECGSELDFDECHIAALTLSIVYGLELGDVTHELLENTRDKIENFVF